MCEHCVKGNQTQGLASDSLLFLTQHSTAADSKLTNLSTRSPLKQGGCLQNQISNVQYAFLCYIKLTKPNLVKLFIILFIYFPFPLSETLDYNGADLGSLRLETASALGLL